MGLERWGGTKEFHAQFPKLPPLLPFHTEVSALILERCEAQAGEFNRDSFSFWQENFHLGGPTHPREMKLTQNWQLRLLTTNLASFSVWSYKAIGGNGNWNKWAGENYVWENNAIHGLRLVDLFSADLKWQPQLRARIGPKFAVLGHCRAKLT